MKGNKIIEKIFLLLFSFIALASCSKDDEYELPDSLVSTVWVHIMAWSAGSPADWSAIYFGSTTTFTMTREYITTVADTVKDATGKPIKNSFGGDSVRFVSRAVADTTLTGSYLYVRDEAKVYLEPNNVPGSEPIGGTVGTFEGNFLYIEGGVNYQRIYQ